ncbi:MAG: hypothetical protein K8S62_05955 [Candidatus Sabulitectum sp.]|nr:hypothetical protein [Candidatus Sabulitectum sp.]
MTKITMILAVLLAVFAFGCVEQGDSPAPVDGNGETGENGEAVETGNDSDDNELIAGFELATPEVGQWIAYGTDSEEGEFKLSIVAEEDYDGITCLWYQIEVDGEAVAQILVDPSVLDELIAVSSGYMEEFVVDPVTYIQENMPEDGGFMGTEDAMENMMLSLRAIKQVKINDGTQLMLLDMAGVPELVEQMIADNPEMLEQNMELPTDDPEFEEFMTKLEGAEFSVEEIEVDGMNCMQFTASHHEEGSMVAVISSELPIVPLMEATVTPNDPEEEGGTVFVTGFGFDGAENLMTGEPDQVIPLAMMLQGFASQMQQAPPQNAPIPQ